MKAKRTILLALAGSLVSGSVIAQQDQPARNYQPPVFRLDDVWLKPLSAPPVWREREFSLGSKTKVTSPALSFLLSPRSAMGTAPRVSSRPELSARLLPPANFNDWTRRRAGAVLLSLRW